MPTLKTWQLAILTFHIVISIQKRAEVWSPALKTHASTVSTRIQRTWFYLQTLATHGFTKLFSSLSWTDSWFYNPSSAFLVLERLTVETRKVVLDERLWHGQPHAKLFSKQKCCVSCQDGSVHFYQIVGRTYRGETQAVMLARNVFYCLSGPEMLDPVHFQSFRPNRRIKWFRYFYRCVQVWAVGLCFHCNCNYHCQPNLGFENVYPTTSAATVNLLAGCREWGSVRWRDRGGGGGGWTEVR